MCEHDNYLWYLGSAYAENVHLFLNASISHKQAMDKANAEYEVFNKTQPIESDFDKAVKKMIEEQK